MVCRQAVDVSPMRRVNQALYLLTTGAREAAFRNIKTIAECLADELINAAKGSSNRYVFCIMCLHPSCYVTAMLCRLTCVRIFGKFLCLGPEPEFQ